MRSSLLAGRRGAAVCATALALAGCAEHGALHGGIGEQDARAERELRVPELAQSDSAESDAPGLPPPASYPRLEATQIGAPVRVRAGFRLAESPVWDHCRERLLFVDVDASVIHELDPAGQLTTFMSNTNYANGVAFDYDGSLLLAQMGGGRGGRIVRRKPDGTLVTLADRSPQGRPLHTVDDVTVRADGTIYFTDADFPHGTYEGYTLSALPLYVLKPGSTQLVRGPAVGGPNGVELSPDEKTLYLSSYFGDRVLKYSVAADGTLTSSGTLATRLDKSDSLCLDAAGNVYVGVATGLQVLRADGSRVTLLRIRSAEGTTNCTFGGPDGKTLYITSFEALYKVENMPIPGNDYVKLRARRSCSEG